MHQTLKLPSKDDEPNPCLSLWVHYPRDSHWDHHCYACLPACLLGWLVSLLSSFHHGCWASLLGRYKVAEGNLSRDKEKETSDNRVEDRFTAVVIKRVVELLKVNLELEHLLFERLY